MDSCDSCPEREWEVRRGWVGVLLAGGLALGFGIRMADAAEGRAVGPADAVTVAITNLPLGVVQLNAAERWVSFPVSVNQRTGVVEYVLVTGTGKTHESVLRTEAEPHHIHVGLLLLGAQPASTPLFPSDLATPPPGEPVRLEVYWATPEGPVLRPLEDLVVTTNQWQMLPRGPWIYNGSYLSRGVFVAQAEGSIVALQIDPSALLNNPRSGRDNDDLHYVNPAVLPPDGTPMSVRIRLGETAANSAASASRASPLLPHPAAGQLTPPLGP